MTSNRRIIQPSSRFPQGLIPVANARILPHHQTASRGLPTPRTTMMVLPAGQQQQYPTVLYQQQQPHHQPPMTMTRPRQPYHPPPHVAYYTMGSSATQHQPHNRQQQQQYRPVMQPICPKPIGVGGGRVGGRGSGSGYYLVPAPKTQPAIKAVQPYTQSVGKQLKIYPKVVKESPHAPAGGASVESPPSEQSPKAKRRKSNEQQEDLELKLEQSPAETKSSSSEAIAESIAAVTEVPPVISADCQAGGEFGEFHSSSKEAEDDSEAMLDDIGHGSQMQSTTEFLMAEVEKQLAATPTMLNATMATTPFFEEKVSRIKKEMVEDFAEINDPTATPQPPMLSPSISLLPVEVGLPLGTWPSVHRPSYVIQQPGERRGGLFPTLSNGSTAASNSSSCVQLQPLKVLHPPPPPRLIGGNHDVRPRYRAAPRTSHLNICTNCGTKETSLWRRSLQGLLECNACNLYAKMNGVPRPKQFCRRGVLRRVRSRLPYDYLERVDSDGGLDAGEGSSNSQMAQNPSTVPSYADATPDSLSDDEEPIVIIENHEQKGKLLRATTATTNGDGGSGPAELNGGESTASVRKRKITKEIKEPCKKGGGRVEKKQRRRRLKQKGAFEGRKRKGVPYYRMRRYGFR